MPWFHEASEMDDRFIQVIYRKKEFNQRFKKN